MTLLLRVSPSQPDPTAIDRAAHCLRRGGLVAFPTETVYGLGASARDATAVRRIFSAKGRPASDPLIVHLADSASMAGIATSITPDVERLAASFWPGPLTLVLPRAVGLPDEVTAGGPTVAVRVPAHPVAQALLRASRVPIAAPSANLFSRPSPTTAAHVLQDLEGAIEIVLDGGATTFGIESTVLDMSGDRPRILRPGAISLEMLRRCLPIVDFEAPPDSGAPLKSPGLLDKHYAPRAPLHLYQGPAPVRRARMLADTGTSSADGQRVGILAATGDVGAFRKAGAVVAVELGDERDLSAMASRLYSAIRAVDTPEVTLILASSVEARGGLADAIRDRLRRSAAGHVVSVLDA